MPVCHRCLDYELKPVESKVAKIGKYEIVGTLGKGAMGTVYEGVDPFIKRSVAIKIIRAQGNEDVDIILRERFVREAQAAGVLQHPNIVSIYEYGEDGDTTYIAMELVKGESIADRLKRRAQFSISDTCNIVLQILAALEYAHSKSVVHRDIKPGNIMLTDDGRVKITDFGIAKIESSDLTQTGTVLGTPGYMSPEQLVGQNIDARSDLFSTGVLLYEMLTGEKAFDGSSITSVMYKVVNVDPIPPAKLCPNLPDFFDFIDQKAIAKKPEMRYQSAGEFAADLRKILDGGSLHQASISESTWLDPDKTVVMRASATHPGNQVAWSDSPSLHPSEVEAQRITPGKPPSQTPTGKKRGLIVYLAVGLGVMSIAAYSMFMFLSSSGDTDDRTSLVESPSISNEKESAKGSEIHTPSREKEEIIHQEAHTQQESEVEIEQAEIASYREVPRAKPGDIIKDCVYCPQLIVVPSGTMEIGSPADESGRIDSEGPSYLLSLDYPFAVGIFEVTKAEYEIFVQETGYKSDSCQVYDGKWHEAKGKGWQDPGFKQTLWHPVTCVSWQDAQAYIGWLSNETGNQYRLLSSSEWEYVARAGESNGTPWSSSGEMACDYANVADMSAEQKFDGWEVYGCSDNFANTSPAGSYMANGFGVHDLLGNVFEWVEDCWNENYENAPADGSAWKEGDCTLRVLRGGSWFSRPEFQRFAYRNRFPEKARSSTFGFRVARLLE